MPQLAMPNEVLVEIFRLCTYNDLNAVALTSRQLGACALQLSPITRMHCLEVSSQGFTLHYSPNSPRKRLFPTFDEFADCARKVRPKIHIMELVNMHDSEEEDGFLRKLLSIEVYRIRTDVVNSFIHMRFYCAGVMYEGMWKHSEMCAHSEDWKTLLHKCHNLKVECFEDPKFRNYIASGLAKNELKEHTETFLASETYPGELYN